MNSEAAQIEHYLNGTLKSGDREKFEAGMENDLFLSEAVAGFRKDPGALHDLPDFATHFWGWAWGVAGIALVLMVFFAVSPKPNRGIYGLDFAKPALVKPIPEMANKPEVPAFEPPNPKRNAKGVTVDPFPELVEEPSVRRDGNFVNPIDFQMPAQLTVWHEPPHLIIDADILYILDFKTIDYSKTPEQHPILDLNELTSHTPANFDSQNSFQLQTSISKRFSKAVDLTYTDLLESGLKAMHEKDYKIALRAFGELAIENSEDVNAAFYSGICRFEIGDYSAALDLFTKVEKTMNPAFGPEARWYRSRCLIKLGRTDEAEIILREIVVGGGHYAERAKKVLEN